MSVQRQGSLNPTLTNFAQGNAPDRLRSIADWLAPIVIVPSTMGQYKRYSEKNSFQVIDTSRAIGGEAKQVEFSSDDPTYNCKPQALEIGIDMVERDAAGPNQSQLEEGKTMALLDSAAIGHENKVLDVCKTLAAVSGIGQWSDRDASPVDELDLQIERIANETGRMPNAVAFGISAWRIFRNHPKVTSRCSGAALVGVTTEQASAMLMNPGMEIRVGVLSKDTTKFGAAASKVNIVGAEVFLFIRNPSPTVYDPSWMKTFSAGSGGVSAVRQWSLPSGRGDRLALDWSEDIQITNTAAARRISIT